MRAVEDVEDEMIAVATALGEQMCQRVKEVQLKVVLGGWGRLDAARKRGCAERSRGRENVGLVCIGFPGAITAGHGTYSCYE